MSALCAGPLIGDIATSILLRGGRLIDPFRGVDGMSDVLVEQGRIAALGHCGEPAQVEIDCEGMLILPCFIDLHAHLRNPGQAHKETVATGTRAAAAGGFGTVVAMANTSPVIDTPARLRQSLETAKPETRVRLFQVGAVSRGLQGAEPADHESLVAAGAIALSDDGRNVHSESVMRAALAFSALSGVPVMVHAEDREIAAGGVVNGSGFSSAHGWPGMAREAEYLVVERDLQLLQEEGGHLHVQHVSCEETVDLLRAARARGLRVTAEVTPHHLALSEEAVAELGGQGRVNPPLRSQRDVEALRRALADGVVDAVATDHAPHESAVKDVDVTVAAPGFSGFETAAPVLLSLVQSEQLSLATVVAALTSGPASVIAHADALPRQGICVGESADIVVIDPHTLTVVDPDQFHSLGHNNPWRGQQLPGRVVLTLAGGRVAHASTREVQLV